MALERRIDPEDGSAYTFEEMVEFYHSYTKKAVKAYWDQECSPAKTGRPSAKAKTKGKAKAEAKAEVEAEAEAKSKAKAKAKGKATAKAKGTAKAVDTDAKVGTSKGADASDRSSRVTPAASGKALVQTMARRERDWRIGPIVYQVFVDRFAPSADLDSKKHLYPAPCKLYAWSELPQAGECDEGTKYWMHELAFWGGDLQSLCSKADYIKDLGADILYMQPIVEGFSNHKYDTTDYFKVEPQYGTIDDFKALTSAAHDSGMKVVLDGVFNHMGIRSHVFKEAMDDKDSSKRDWFFLGDEYKSGFKTWGGSATLTELRLENPSLQQYLWKGKESVVAHWLAAGADGWRLDVASEIGFALLKSITGSAHRHKRGSLVVGEVWAYPPQWTSCMDGVMSLHLGVLVYGLVDGSCPGPSAAQSIARMIEDSSMEEVLRSWIVISNHDMPRLAARLPEVRLRKFAQALQFTWPGAPLVYYGDELGLEGGDDPRNRAPMPWHAVADDNEMLEHTRKMVALRKRLRALRIGDYRALPSQRLMAFVRTTDRVMDVVVVLANPTDEPVKEMVVIPVPAILGYTLFKDELSGEEVRALGSTFTMEVAAKSMRILSMADESGNPSGDQYKRIYGHHASFKHIKP
mmetsp:Transcript_71972/g.210842  ORF Transcript_71972/g.210842 Transcript_71972/m.210842 type:complete len:633 (+) Transcript_71972:63-1961(+)